MTDQATLFNVTIDGNTAQVNLAQLAEVDISHIPAHYRGALPVGRYHFSVKEAELATREFNDDESPTGKTVRPYIGFILTVRNCISLAKNDVAPEDTIGAEHREMIIIRDLKRDVGLFVALCEQANIPLQGPLPQAIPATAGYDFIGGVTHSPNKNDPDRPWVNLDMAKGHIQPVAQQAPAQAAAPASAPAQPATGGVKLAGLPGGQAAG